MKKQQPYTPDWASIPAEFNHVAVDRGGEVCIFTSKPKPYVSAWFGGWCELLCVIDAPPGDTWRTMLYERPKNETHSPADAVSAA